MVERMREKPINVLLVDDNPEDVQRITDALIGADDAVLCVETASRLSEGLERLTKGSIDVVLLDLVLPDSEGLETLHRINRARSNVPIVALGDVYDHTLALKTVQAGAQDYVLKMHVNSNMILRIIRYAIERHRLLEKISSLSLVDELTGLYNRRGFTTLAQQQLNTAERTKDRLSLVYLDLDGMKQINDTYGHPQGDEALIQMANILKETFRKSDIIARMGGDEFAILAVGTSMAGAKALIARLRERLETHNARTTSPWRLAVSVGVALYDPVVPCSLSELLARADGAMYEEKRKKYNRGA